VGGHRVVKWWSERRPLTRRIHCARYVATRRRAPCRWCVNSGDFFLRFSTALTPTIPPPSGNGRWDPQVGNHCFAQATQKSGRLCLIFDSGGSMGVERDIAGLCRCACQRWTKPPVGPLYWRKVYPRPRTPQFSGCGPTLALHRVLRV
jgi:hypothetical protein